MPLCFYPTDPQDNYSLQLVDTMTIQVQHWPHYGWRSSKKPVPKHTPREDISEIAGEGGQRGDRGQTGQRGRGGDEGGEKAEGGVTWELPAATGGQGAGPPQPKDGTHPQNSPQR